jgi:hypothetical protein
MFSENSATQVAGSPFALAELLPGLYRANPAQTDVFSDGLYRLEFIKGGASLIPPVRDTYQLKGGQEAALAPVTTDAASRTASQNDLSAIATTVQVNDARDAVNTNTNTARDAVLLQGNTNWATGLTTPQQTQLNTIQTLATIATEPITNRTVIDQTAKTYTVFQADGVTPRVIKDLKNATGAASSEAVYSEIPRP